MDKKNRLWIIVLWLIVIMVVASTAQAERCSRAYMRNPTGDLTKIVIRNDLAGDTDIVAFYNAYNCRVGLGDKIYSYVNYVRDDIRGSWHFRQRIVDNVKDKYVPWLQGYLEEISKSKSDVWGVDDNTKKRTFNKIVQIFANHANHLYDTLCRCVISPDGSRSCAPPDMPDSF